MAAAIRIAQRVNAGDSRWEYDSQGYINSDVVTGTTLSLATGQTLLRLCGWSAYNSGNNVLYLMFFDAASLPGNGATPMIMPFPLRALAQYRDGDAVQIGSREFYAQNFKAGIVWAASTTPATLTVDATNSVWVTMWIQ